MKDLKRMNTNTETKAITPVSQDRTVRLKETPKSLISDTDIDRDQSEVNESSPAVSPAISSGQRFKIVMNNESFTSNQIRRKITPPNINTEQKQYNTDKKIPLIKDSSAPNKKRESKVRFIDNDDDDLDLDDDYMEDTSNLSKIDAKFRSMSVKPELNTADALHKFQSRKSFLNTPHNAMLERRMSDVSIHSMDSNVFKRGMESMLTHRRRSTLFEKSSKASMIAESEQGITQINQYKLLKQIGKGSYSVIRLAYHVEQKKYYAMKIINIKKMKRTMTSKSTTGVDSLETEIEIMKKIKGNHCVKLAEVIADEEDGQAYLAIDYIQKGSLDSLRKHTKLTEDAIRKYFRQLILGVEYLHSIGIIHRDIKPDNLLIDENDDLKITDFGISVLINDGNDTFTNTAGTNYFFCPES